MAVQVRGLDGWEIYHDDGRKEWLPDDPKQSPGRYKRKLNIAEQEAAKDWYTSGASSTTCPMFDEEMLIAFAVEMGEWTGTFMRLTTPDPFGASLAEALRREDEVVPHPVRRVETEAEKDALWESVERYARGG